MTVDLVETVYGLGYRLKSLQEDIESQKVALETAETAKSQETLSAESSGSSQELNNDDRRLKVLNMVAQMRENLKANFIDKVAIFERAIAQLKSGTLEGELRQEAQAQAHKLVGSLGTLGLPKGSEVARKIEHLFKAENILQPDTAQQIEGFLQKLTQIFDRPSPEPEGELVPAVSPQQRMLIVDDTFESEQLKIVASANGFQIEVANSPQAARNAIFQQPPDAILLDLTFSRTQENGLSLLAELLREKPEIPVMIFSRHNQLSDRIEVARLGASGFLHKSIPPADILKAVAQVLDQAGPAEAKVMVVDDDVHLLAALQVILQPWGFQVTTLDEPEKFWEVLETTCPDLLILDVEMPGYSGIELCLAVRNDLRWSKLPVLFLTAHSEPETVRQMFVAGADDYVNKPIVKPELIASLLNRLERTQLRHRLAQAQH